MSIRSPSETAARTARGAAKVVVAVIAGPDALLVATPEMLRQWRRLTPLAVWSAVSVGRGNSEEILRSLATEMARLDVEPHRLILLAEGKTARAALELVLQGAIDCAGLLAIAAPGAPLPFPIVPTAAAIRLVVRRQDREDAPADLITALRASYVDTRIIGFDAPAANDLRAAASAAETYVLELVANASRQNRHHGV
ncbi:hypothetical protein [Bradyrhizobium commune]|uniref:Uncharacterized protein n=1 Tax=Bradyrhizobium commune TaxID=83627 RepID=A0A7S9GYJ9_9BRAD|nr:hypothetical protein [Bradyrhizobium commune]QPF89926.1 hypothetical protein IC761_25950 [Bradyrhizobium commune]